MSNINCTDAECAFMKDGKCTLAVITPAAGKAEGEHSCPYYRSSENSA